MLLSDFDYILPEEFIEHNYSSRIIFLMFFSTFTLSSITSLPQPRHLMRKSAPILKTANLSARGLDKIREMLYNIKLEYYKCMN